MKLIFFLLPLFFVFGQWESDTLGLKVKKAGFYYSPKSLFYNSPQINESNNKDLNKLLEKSIKNQSNKIYFKNNENNNFAYSNGHIIYLNAGKFKENLNYFIKTQRWNEFYLFEDQFINFYPGGFVNYGVGFDGIFSNNIGFGNSFNIQNVYCVFSIDKEDFFCLEKNIVRSRIRKYSKEISKKFRKSNRQIENLIDVFDEIYSKDSTIINKIWFE